MKNISNVIVNHAEGGEVISREEYFKGVSFKKIGIGVFVWISVMLFLGVVTGRAEDNKTTERGFPKILDDDKWTTQILYDTVGACYQGTIKWIIMSNPSLLGQMPGPIAQRQMVEHCFCVMDKVRKEQSIKEYLKKVFNHEFIGQLFLAKALECIGEYKTLPSFFRKTPDNETKIDNDTIKIPEEPEDSKEESPEQPMEESNGLPETLFQG